LREKRELSGAIAEFREVIALDPENFNARHYLGVTLREKGELPEAITVLRRVVQLEPNNSHAHNDLGMALRLKGDLDGAIDAFREALELNPGISSARDDLIRVELLRKLLPRLPDVLAGKDKPATPTEAFAFAELCRLQRRYAATARLFEQAFAAASKLADDLAGAHRYNAACLAARAARGEGIDAPAAPTERDTLRAKALAWLRADLALRKPQAASSREADRAEVALRVARWLRDPDLSGLRPGVARPGMPPDERATWEAFWVDVKAMLALASKPLPPRPDDGR
jgi:tetratricopeptide (TPR) repeat protein